MHRLILSEEDIRAVKSLLAELTSQYTSVEEPNFLKDSSILAHDLPRGLRLCLDDFKKTEPPHGVCLISGYPVDDGKIGATPTHWREKQAVSPTLEEEMLFLLCGSLLGDMIGWACQQDGYIVHDVLPIKEDENAQISSGSQQTIWWHNEDAFHPYRGDYVGLMCLRNPDNVATTFTSMERVRLSTHHKNILFEPRFIIRPDESHEADRDAFNLYTEANEDFLKTARRSIAEMRSKPQRLPVLFGDPRSPYIRIDPYFMDPLEDDEAQSALNALVRAVDECLQEIVLRPGDLIFLDNYCAVHGRKSFKARYDGTDRWLKRANITRDLRKSRNARPNCLSRIIF